MKTRLVLKLTLMVVVVLTVATSVSGESSAQTSCSWISTVSNLYVSPTTCNVGIGTTAPLYRAHVRVGTNQNFHIRPSFGGLAGGVLLNAANDADSLNVPLQFAGSLFSFYSGNVGIGTTAPASKFHTMWSSINPGTGVRFADAGIFENNGNVYYQLLGSSTGEKTINFGDPTSGVRAAIKYDLGNNDAMGFWLDNNQERMRILANGNSRTLGAGTFGSLTATGGQLGIFNTGNWAYSLRIVGPSTYGQNNFFTVNNNGNVGIRVGSVNINNILEIEQNSSTDPIADAWTVYSSRRWKTNIKTVDGAIDLIKQLRGVSFVWKETGRHDIGLVAEEVGLVIPEVVVYEENGVDAKSVDYARLVAVLIEAIKEQQVQIEVQQATLDALVDKQGTTITISNDDDLSAEKRIVTLEQEVTALKAEKTDIEQRVSTLEAQVAALEKTLAAGNTQPFGAGQVGSWSLVIGLVLVGLSSQVRRWKDGR